MTSDDRLKKVTAGIEAEEWGPPVYLDSVDTPPPFPVEDLPGWTQEFVTALAHTTQTPPDLAGTLTLAVLAACSGGRVDVEVRENWAEPLNGYFVVVMGSGESKSPVYTKTVAPLVAYERELQIAAQPDIIECVTRKAVADKRAKQAIDDAAKAKTNRAEAEDYARSVNEEASEIVVPADPRFIVEDMSPEKLVSMLAEQNGRLALISEEGGSFGAMAGRYESKKGGTSAGLDVWLKAYDGAPIRVDRIGRPSDMVDHAYLTIGIAAQPAVIRGLMSDPEMRGRGLLARFCYSIPPAVVGYRDMRALPFTEAMQESWNSRVLTMARTLTVGGRIVVSYEAEEALTQYMETIEPRLRQAADLYAAADWCNKLRGRIARIAGWLHLGDHFDKGWSDRLVDVQTMRRAIRFGSYYLSHALVAFDLMGSDDNRDRMRYILRLFEERPEKFAEPFTSRHVHSHSNRSAIPTSFDAKTALAELVECNWIRPVGKTLRYNTDLYELRPDFAVAIRRQIIPTTPEPPPGLTVTKPTPIPQDSGPSSVEPEPVEPEPETPHIAPFAAPEDSDTEGLLLEAFPDAEVVEDSPEPTDDDRLTIFRAKYKKLDRTAPTAVRVREMVAVIRKGAGVDYGTPLEAWMFKDGQLAALEALLKDVAA